MENCNVRFYARTNRIDEEVIKEQLAECYTLAKTLEINGCEVKEYVDNGVTGYDPKPQLHEMVKGVHSELKIFMRSPDRISRDCDEVRNFLLGINKAGAEIFFTDGTRVEDLLKLSKEQFAFADLERRALSQRQRRRT